MLLALLCGLSRLITSSDWCALCGCSAEVHRHNRPGLDCGACGREKCPAFTAVLVRRSEKP